MSASRPTPPAPLLVGAGLLGLQGLGLLGLGVFEVVHLRSNRIALALTTTVFFLVLGAGLLMCARGLAQVSSWARSPVVALELIGLLTAFSFYGGETTPVALALAAVSAGVLVGVLHPSSTRALVAAPD